MRLPLGGMFPAYDEPKKYFALADTIGDLRTRWFVYRSLLARTAPENPDAWGQALTQCTRANRRFRD